MQTVSKHLFSKVIADEFTITLLIGDIKEMWEVIDEAFLLLLIMPSSQTPTSTSSRQSHQSCSRYHGHHQPGGCFSL